ncbi:right-handed parallel beta-helix repeat-containing protein [Arthrobacter sp. C9C5]|uniref:right-handed parallel beta-helix repeat-containing protein n=1 Tax=Arthrobacter sp. C9C5 TaxID=2735267 RepID=UPI00158526FD|nr:right-handed parallel beta-helix repeat-containing protein [Arthrobacter sp. C9C5]NUU31983.1 right-handed parallel beta-helix repeat-containing protein [Arthrobacter sp. C9C5]
MEFPPLTPVPGMKRLRPGRGRRAVAVVALVAGISLGPVTASPAATPVVDATVPAGGSIQAVINAAPEGARIGVPAGTFRISSALSPKRGQKLLALGGAGTAVIKGSKVVTGWVKDGSQARWYKNGLLPAAYSDSGQCEVNSGAAANPCRKREQVYRNGVPLKRSMRLADLRPNGFFQDYTTNRTWLGSDPANATLEVARTPHAINSSVSGVTLSGLTFTQFASPSQKGAVVAGGTDWVIENCTFKRNHAIGLQLANAARARIRNNAMIENGQLGMGHYASNNTIVENNEIARNNTAGYWGADWESGGFKATYSNSVMFRGNNVHDNRGTGTWFDINNMNATILGNSINNNYADGIRYEISYKALISDNRLAGNGYGLAAGDGRGSDYSLYAVAAINVNSSPDVEIRQNILGKNQNGIAAQMRNRGSGSYGAWDLHNLNVHHNDVTLATGTRPGEGVQGLGTLSPVSPATYYHAKNNRFDYNTYRMDAAARRFSWNKSYMTFASFQSAGQERHGKLLRTG